MDSRPPTAPPAVYLPHSCHITALSKTYLEENLPPLVDQVFWKDLKYLTKDNNKPDASL